LITHRYAVIRLAQAVFGRQVHLLPRSITVERRDDQTRGHGGAKQDLQDIHRRLHRQHPPNPPGAARPPAANAPAAFASRARNCLGPNTMYQDPLVDETRALREAYAAEHGHDLDIIFEDLLTRQAKTTRTVVSRPPRKPAMSPSPNQQFQICPYPLPARRRGGGCAGCRARRSWSRTGTPRYRMASRRPAQAGVRRRCAARTGCRAPVGSVDRRDPAACGREMPKA